MTTLARHVPNWGAMLARGLEAGDEAERIAHGLRTGRPLGGSAWAAEMEARCALPPRRARGRPRRSSAPSP